MKKLSLTFSRLIIIFLFSISFSYSNEQNIIEGKLEEETKKPKEFKGFAEGRSK